MAKLLWKRNKQLHGKIALPELSFFTRENVKNVILINVFLFRLISYLNNYLLFESKKKKFISYWML